MEHDGITKPKPRAAHVNNTQTHGQIAGKLRPNYCLHSVPPDSCNRALSCASPTMSSAISQRLAALSVFIALPLLPGCSGLVPAVTMMTTGLGGQQGGNTGSALGRRDFLRTAAAGLIGAGVGVGTLAGRANRATAAEPLVETCEEKRVSCYYMQTEYGVRVE